MQCHGVFLDVYVALTIFILIIISIQIDQSNAPFEDILPLKMDTNVMIQLIVCMSMDVHILKDTSYFSSLEAIYFQFVLPLLLLMFDAGADGHNFMDPVIDQAPLLFGSI